MPTTPPVKPSAQALAAHVPPGTPRSQAKENRRQALLTAAAALFALHGFNRVSLEDLGAAAGVSGPAVYRHFQGKQAVLGDLLLTVSRELLDGGRRVIAGTTDPLAAPRRPGGVRGESGYHLGAPRLVRGVAPFHRRAGRLRDGGGRDRRGTGTLHGPFDSGFAG
mgnify:CR=1 FL=1